MKKNFSEQNISSLSIALENDARLVIERIEGNTVNIEAHLRWDFIPVKFERNGNALSVKIKGSFPHSSTNGFFSSMVNLFSVSGRKNFFDMEAAQIENQDHAVLLQIQIPDTLKELKIKMNNGILHLHGGKLEFLKIHANNCKLTSLYSVAYANAIMKLNNCKLMLGVSGTTGEAEIACNNGKIVIQKAEDFLGSIRVTGNNLKLKGLKEISGLINSIVSITGNNCVVKLTEVQCVTNQQTL